MSPPSDRLPSNALPSNALPSNALAATERAGLAGLLAVVGPDAPTCCAGWTAAHLAAHLVVRDSRLDAVPGYALETLPIGGLAARWSHRLEDRLRGSIPYPELVARVRSGPRAWFPLAWPVLDRLANTGEFVIHHEDVRRAQPDWAPRALPRSAQDQLWPLARLFARRAAGSRPEGLLLRRADVPGVEQRYGDAGTTVVGEPLELLLWSSGRTAVARVELS